MDGMDGMGFSSSSSSSNSTSSMTMTPYFHFTAGDNLLFHAWAPSSKGAIAGACIGLVAFAIFDRWLNAMRGLLELYWRRKTLGLNTPSEVSEKVLDSSKDGSCCSAKDKTRENRDGDVDSVVQALPVDSSAVETGQTGETRSRIKRIRTIPPFVLAHDLPRGVIHGVQSLSGYVLMLAAMTFNAAYLISIVVGLGIGEMLFGRMGSFHQQLH